MPKGSGGGGRSGRSGGGGGGMDMSEGMNIQNLYPMINTEYSSKGVSVGISRGMPVQDPGQRPKYGDVISMRAKNGADASIYPDRMMVGGKKYTDLIKGLSAFEKDARI